MARAFAALTLSVALALVVSCGGAVFDDDDEGGASGSGGATAGTGATGGSGKGGAVNGGSSAGGSSSAGHAGTAGSPDRCSLPAESGQCDAYFPSFFHNPETGVCEPFVYGGCGGNDNRFESAEECQATCSGVAPDLDACTSTTECVLVHTACCAPCQRTLQDTAAINVNQQQAFAAAHECDPAPPCAPCPAPDPETDSGRYLTAVCRAGQCVPIDVRQEGAANCDSPSDCRLRDGVSCCEGCSSSASELVAVSIDGTLEKIACGDGMIGCDGCLPTYPPEYVASCELNRCELRILQP
jgi:hypothetical protein